MKTLVLTLTLVIIPFFVSAEKISRNAWYQLRDMHRWHLENVDKQKWIPERADTDAFLRDTIRPYFLTQIEEHKKLDVEYKKICKEQMQLRKERNIFLSTTVVLGLLFIIMVLFIFIPLIKSHKKQPSITVTENCCPRCGSKIGCERKCNNCGTYI